MVLASGPVRGGKEKDERGKRRLHGSSIAKEEKRKGGGPPSRISHGKKKKKKAPCFSSIKRKK